MRPLLLLCALAFGCEPAKLNLRGTPDAGGTVDGGDNSDGGAAANCDPAVQTADDGHHNAGLDCMSCHNGQMQAAPMFKLAGTLYTSGAGAAPAVGMTIRVHAADGQTLKIVTAKNGNFYTTTPIQFPVMVEASACPDTQSMGDPVEGPAVSCNSCHVTGGGAGERIHLP